MRLGLTIGLEDGVSVHRVQTCHLTASDAVWAYALENKDKIDQHWQQARQRNPNFFDGRVWLIASAQFDGPDRFEAALVRTSFRACLYWRARNFEPAGVLDGFGSCILQSRDGAILLARQQPGHVNDGFYYPPSGFIDDQDVSEDRRIDIDASIVREAHEELGFDVTTLHRRVGYWIVRSEQQLAIAAVYRHSLDKQDLARAARAQLAKQTNPELADVAMVDDVAALDDLQVPRYVRPLVSAILDEQR